ncbi:hypothetical protein BC940DRAFT_298766 [Gongronella butleri]|nr:hypothetical protein BC940DRAFT_298766 [Gongronella butleri]
MIKRFKAELETEHGDINVHGSLHVRGNALLVTADGRVNCHGPTLVADNLQIQAHAAVQLSGLVRILYQLSIDTADDAVYAHHARIQAQILKINATHGPIILDDVSQICDAHISTIDAPIHVNMRTINSPGHAFIRLHTTNAPISLHLSCDFYGSFALEADQIDIQEPNKSIVFENDKHGTIGRLRG